MRLITFLGTGNYAETHYTYNGEECKTRYIAAALATFLHADSIVVLATEQARDAHAQGLRDELTQLGLPDPDIRAIPSGGAPEELWQQFEVISKAVMDDNPKTVSFDITHGFRAQPFFAAAVINYLRATLQDVPTMQAFYGEWRKDEETSPVWDISTFINLLDWSSALQGFMKTGHGAELAKLAKRENANIQQAKQGVAPRNLSSLADAIKAFSDNIATVRVPQIITEKGRGSAAHVLQAIMKSDGEVQQHFKPLHPILAQLKTKLEGIPADSLFNPAGHSAMLALAKLYVDYERYPEAAIVVREGWVSLYADKNQPDKQLLSQEARKEMENRWYKKEGPHSPDRVADQISTVRNDIQHGGFKPDPKPADSLIRDLQGLLEKFEAKIKPPES